MAFMRRLSLDGRVALVMGAGGGGIGTQTSLALAEAGATVVAVDVSEEQVRDTEARIAAAGGRCAGHVADARDAGAVARIVQESWDEHGAIDHLVNVVGGSRRGQWRRAEEYPEDMFDAVIEFNLRTHFLACREVGRRMIEHGVAGSIVNFSSIAGLHMLPYQIGYGAAKAAVINLTRALAVEWGPHGIRVNAIAPGGGIDTPRVMTPESRREDPIYGPANWNPLARSLDPEELAAAALFLVSDLASAVTGQTLTVDAGVTSRMPSGGLDVYGRYLP